jgi:hypothetical protein
MLRARSLTRPRLLLLASIVVVALAACSSTSKSAATNSTASTSASAGSVTSSAGAVSATCPSRAAISAAAGARYPAPAVSSGGGFTSCNYNDAATGVNLDIVFTKAAGTTANVLQAATNAQAAAQHVKAEAVPGYGTAAYLFTYGSAGGSANGIAPSNLDVLAGSETIDIAGSEPVAQIEKIARSILGS